MFDLEHDLTKLFEAIFGAEPADAPNTLRRFLERTARILSNVLTVIFSGIVIGCVYMRVVRWVAEAMQLPESAIPFGVILLVGLTVVFRGALLLTKMVMVFARYQVFTFIGIVTAAVAICRNAGPAFRTIDGDMSNLVVVIGKFILDFFGIPTG